MSKVQKGQSVKVHYRGTLNDGREFDNSQKRGRPVDFVVGAGNVILGFEKAVLGMAEGETKSITLPPEQAYGPINPQAIIEVPKKKFPEDFEFKENGFVRSTRMDGRPLFGKINIIKEETVILDVNHPLAGKELTFEIQLLEIENNSDNFETEESIDSQTETEEEASEELTDIEAEE